MSNPMEVMHSFSMLSDAHGVVLKPETNIFVHLRTQNSQHVLSVNSIDNRLK